ncbi:winged helix-turn-helix transcriptional regulator [Oceanobacillus sp. FSL W8-0428]|uniref:winged helix-turn-helix transcriptional regulator n=1 Tax=Oceanobacillus sp. FSL W8-0428 TaxID=2921715 RepID=UPI004046F13F
MQRFGELRKLIPDINQMILINHLYELKNCRTVKCTVCPIMPPHGSFQATQHSQLN